MFSKKLVLFYLWYRILHELTIHNNVSSTVAEGVTCALVVTGVQKGKEKGKLNNIFN